MVKYGCLWDVYGRYSCNYSSCYFSSKLLLGRPACDPKTCQELCHQHHECDLLLFMDLAFFVPSSAFFSMFLWIKLQSPSVQPTVAPAEGASCGRLCHLGLTRGSLRRGDFSLDRCLDDVTCCWLCNHLGTLAAMLSLLHLVPLVIFPKFKSEISTSSDGNGEMFASPLRIVLKTRIRNMSCYTSQHLELKRPGSAQSGRWFE